MNALNDILNKLKKSGFLIVFGVCSFYFVVNAIKGDRGIVLNMVKDDEYVILESDIDKN